MEIKGIYYCDVCDKQTVEQNPICSDECFQFAKQQGEHNLQCDCMFESCLTEKESLFGTIWFLQQWCNKSGKLICERKLSFEELQKYRNKFNRQISSLKKATLK